MYYSDIEEHVESLERELDETLRELTEMRAEIERLKARIEQSFDHAYDEDIDPRNPNFDHAEGYRHRDRQIRTILEDY